VNDSGQQPPPEPVEAPEPEATTPLFESDDANRAGSGDSEGPDAPASVPASTPDPPPPGGVREFSVPPRPAHLQESGSTGSGAASAARQVASIVSAAEDAAERLRVQTEERVRARIAEGERAAQNRVNAAEDEATDIGKWAQEEAARLREAGRIDADQAVAEATSEALRIVQSAQESANRLRTESEQAKTAATSEALAIVAKAQEVAEQSVREAEEAAKLEHDTAGQKARALLSEARNTASDVRTEGMELVGNLREMADSLRSNAERLLRDVQSIHSRMLAQIERAEQAAGRSGASGTRPSPTVDSPADPSYDAPSSRRSPRDRDAPMLGDGGEVLDVPEFIPRG
jgi:vacuolar-type H+-ATPase subunit H